MKMCTQLYQRRPCVLMMDSTIHSCFDTEYRSPQWSILRHFSRPMRRDSIVHSANGQLMSKCLMPDHKTLQCPASHYWPKKENPQIRQQLTFFRHAIRTNAVWKPRAKVRAPVGVHRSIDGSYISALLSPVPPTTNTLPSFSTDAEWLVRGWTICPVAVHLPVDGSYNSAVGLLAPPATKTFPFCSTEEVWSIRKRDKLPVDVHKPVDELYSSVVFWSDKQYLPVTTTLPSSNTDDACDTRAWVMLPVPDHPKCERLLFTNLTLLQFSIQAESGRCDHCLNEFWTQEDFQSVTSWNDPIDKYFHDCSLFLHLSCSSTGPVVENHLLKFWMTHRC